jgi:hypothetical protein
VTEEGAATPVAAGRSGRELFGQDGCYLCCRCGGCLNHDGRGGDFCREEREEKRGTVACGEAAG